MAYYQQEDRAVAGNHCATQGTCTESLRLSVWQRSEYARTLKLSRTWEIVEKPHYKRISEGLTHVAALHHGTPGPKFTKFGNKFSFAIPLTLPNFVALRQKVCEISVVEKFCSPKSRLKFTLGRQICHQSIGRTRVSIDTL